MKFILTNMLKMKIKVIIKLKIKLINRNEMKVKMFKMNFEFVNVKEELIMKMQNLEKIEGYGKDENRIKRDRRGKRGRIWICECESEASDSRPWAANNELDYIINIYIININGNKKNRDNRNQKRQERQRK